MEATAVSTRVALPGPVGLKADPRTTPGLFLDHAERFRGRPFLHRYEEAAGGWVPTTWDEFKARVLATAAELIEAGVSAGDRVALMGENSIEWLTSDLAIQAAGAVTVPVYPSLPPASAAQIAENAGAVLAVAGGADLAAKFAGCDVRVLRMDVDLADVLGGRRTPGLGDVGDRLHALRPDDVATIAYTSGTSGQPKGVVITHDAIVETVKASAAIYDIRSTDIILSFLPYSHILERVSGFYFGGVYAGAQLKLSRGLDHLAEDLRLVQPTCMEGVPRLFEKLVQAVQSGLAKRSWPERVLLSWALRTGGDPELKRSLPARLIHRLADRTLLSALRRQAGAGRLRFFVSGGAPLLPEVERFLWAMGIPVFQGWGMTELTGVVTCNTVTDHRFGTVGKAVPGVQLKITADGEILVRSPGVMREYYRNPEATAETLDAGWLKTGDIGRLDDDGYLTITDRKKDLMKTSGGKYVAPQPVETALQHDPCIGAAVLVGDGMPYVTALLLPEWNRVRSDLRVSGSPEELAKSPRVLARLQAAVDAVNRERARFETIKYFRVLPRELEIDRGELTPSLKVRRRVVQEHFQPLIDSMYAGKMLRPLAGGIAQPT